MSGLQLRQFGWAGLLPRSRLEKVLQDRGVALTKVEVAKGLEDDVELISGAVTYVTRTLFFS